MDWVAHIPRELREFALGRNQALVRGGVRNVINISMISDTDPENKVVASVGTALDGVNWLYVSSQCGVLDTINDLSYSFPSGCICTKAGKQYLHYLMLLCKNLKKVDLTLDGMQHDATAAFLKGNTTITSISFPGVDPSAAVRYIAEMLKTNETIITVDYPGMGDDSSYNIVSLLATCVSRRLMPRSVPLSADAGMRRTWNHVRLYQNWLGTREKLAAVVFAMENSVIPQPIAVVILKLAFGNESAGVAQLMADMGRVPQPKRILAESASAEAGDEDGKLRGEKRARIE